MASKTVVEWVDDLDGEPAEETVSFSIDGAEYEIDLSGANAARLRGVLKEFIRKARVEGTEKPEPEVEEPPAPVEPPRSRPAPRSAIKSSRRISAAQLSMDVLEEPEEPTPAKRPARASKPAASKAAAKPAAAAKKTPVKKATSVKAPEPKAAEPAPKKPVADKPAVAKAAEPKPEPKAAEPEPKATAPKAAEPEPKAAEPQRPTMASPFSQPALPGFTPQQGKDDKPARPPMITFTSAKQ